MVVTSDYLENDKEKVLNFFMDNSSYLEISTFLFKRFITENIVYCKKYLANRKEIKENWTDYKQLSSF